MTIVLPQQRQQPPPVDDAPVPKKPQGNPLLSLVKPANRPLAVAAGMFAAAAATTDVPFYLAVPGWAGAGFAAAAGVRAYTRKKHKKFPRHTQKVCCAVFGWLGLASTVRWDHWGIPNTVMATGLAVTGLAAWVGLHPRAPWNNREPEVLELPAAPAPDPEEMFVSTQKAVWAGRVAAGVLASTELVDVKRIGKHGGWQATIILGGQVNDDLIESKDTKWRIARAYSYGLHAVHVTADPNDAGKATLLMLKRNPLWKAVHWDGVGIAADGSAEIAVYVSGATERYHFWNELGAQPDLIAGVMGTGKSETVALLMTMEVMARDALGRGLVASYLIDPQHGQSYTELVDAIAGTAFTLTEQRDLLEGIYAEMLWRNRVLAETPWEQILPNGKKRMRKGLKTWRISAEMPLISVTIDEAHAVLADPLCKVFVEKILAMGRKCGIKIRLITQIPVLSSLGNSSEIAELCKGGNIIIHRTGSSTTGTIAAEGKLGGKPHKLPERWIYEIDGEKFSDHTAGVCYLAGAYSRTEIARVYWVEDPYNWLFKDGELIYTPTVVELPDTGVLAGAIAATAAVTATRCIDWVRSYFAEHAGQTVVRKDLLAAVGDKYSDRTVMYALSDLKEEGFIAPVGGDQSGQYVHHSK